jgi:hypothetical protein
MLTDLRPSPPSVIVLDQFLSQHIESVNNALPENANQVRLVENCLRRRLKSFRPFKKSKNVKSEPELHLMSIESSQSLYRLSKWHKKRFLMDTVTGQLALHVNDKSLHTLQQIFRLGCCIRWMQNNQAYSIDDWELFRREFVNSSRSYPEHADFEKGLHRVFDHLSYEGKQLSVDLMMYDRKAYLWPKDGQTDFYSSNFNPIRECYTFRLLGKKSLQIVRDLFQVDLSLSPISSVVSSADSTGNFKFVCVADNIIDCVILETEKNQAFNLWMRFVLFKSQDETFSTISVIGETDYTQLVDKIS